MLIWSVLASLLVTSRCWAADAVAQTTDRDYYQDKERGWYWYEDPPPEKKKAEPVVAASPVPKPPAKPEPLKPFSSEWLKENMERLRFDAMDNPDDPDKVAAYMYAQRVTIDRSQRFATAASTLARTDPLLDESNRVPLDYAASVAFQRGIQINQKKALKLMAEKGGIFFFFDSRCSFCTVQLQALSWLEKDYGFTVKNISVDGRPLAGMKEWVRDAGQARALGLKIYPTTVFAVPPDKLYIISQGFHAADTLGTKIMMAAVSNNLLPKEMIEIDRAHERGVLTAEDLRDKRFTENLDAKDWVKLLRDKLGMRY